MNKVFLKGNLTRDPELKEVALGERVCSVVNFTLAVSRFYKKSNGETDQTTEFIDCEAWDTGANLVSKILKKGDPVLIEGSLKTDRWEKDGVKHSRVKVRVTNFDKLARFVKQDEQPKEEMEAVVVSDGEDIPF
jgi:single-strand DNA-binding protein